MYKETDTILLVTRPFLPCPETDQLNCNFYFMPLEHTDYISLCETSKAYTYVYIEKILAEKILKDKVEMPENISIMENCVEETTSEQSELKLAFLAGGDTHVNFMVDIARQIENHIFLIPEIRVKDEGAAAALEREKEPYIEVIYGKNKCQELLDYAPQYVFSGADWTSDYNQVKKTIEGTSIRTVALQEGPEDWHIRTRSRVKGNIILRKLNHYRIADVQFLQGARVLSFIRPRYFTVTGNPKVDRIRESELPRNPKVFINCNFTYTDQKPSYESHGVEWVKSIIKVCKELELDYLISQHPRDLSEWDDEHLVKSNAYKVAQQIEDCSICVSRFSNIPYEAYARSRKVVYYNIHLEPMPIFVEDQETEIDVVDTELELKQVLLAHKKTYPYVIDKGKQRKYLHRHIGKPDGHALQRITANLMDMGAYSFKGYSYVSKLVAGIEDICSDKVNKVIAIYTEFNKKDFVYSDYLKMFIAEVLSMLGYKVYIVTNAYAKWYHMFNFLYTHQDIVVELARDFNFEFEQVFFDEVLYLGEQTENNLAEKKARELCDMNNAKWVDNISVESFEKMLKEISNNDTSDPVEIIKKREYWYKLAREIKELL